ncbi:hypothetical protein [Flavicella sediminum]|uniref:hypothetical protein n=1 Tax=Flavicella sediminum TaxID=2585141 RepID=UPI0011225102|nr:hypothetical protein [Flavicella sediminum]
MTKKTLYQTLEDREDPQYIEDNGPFKCTWENTWLGPGYYFWDTFVENAHWWGHQRYNKNHVICKHTCEVDDKNCFDLVGNTDHLTLFSESVAFLRSKNMIKENTTLPRVLAMLKKTGFEYEAIRVSGVNSISKSNIEYSEYIKRINFESGRGQYLDYRPPIQICVFKPNGLNLSSAEIVFPDHYNSSYTI